jgi:exodeoxyribonuclease VII large subunit
MTSFFDFQQKMAASARPAPTPPARSPSAPAAAAGSSRAVEPLTVSALTQQIDRAIRSTLPERVYVRGELSNFKLHVASGHLYFTLKDASACLACVMWKSDAARVRFKPVDGLEVIASGTVKVWPQKGSHQLYATSLQPLGQGALELAFQQVRRKLEAEGLFARERKKPLPPYPMRLALVTSNATAALQDMLKVLRRYPWIRLGVYHVPVQGDGSAERIAAALHHLSRTRSATGIEAILLARGGGSLEDRWEFNEECVARAIAACSVPVVTGIGHEVDVSIADLVADYHAHTPTEAAQVIVGQWRMARDVVGLAGVRLGRSVGQLLASARQRLMHIERHETFRRPLERVNQFRQLLDERQRSLAFAQVDRIRCHQRRLGEIAERLDCHRPVQVVARLRDRLSEQSRRLDAAMAAALRSGRGELSRCVERLRERHPRHLLRLHAHRLTAAETRLQCDLRARALRLHDRVDALAAHLKAVGPEEVLKRGYSITTLRKGGAVIRSAGQVRPGDKLITRLTDGEVESVAQDPNQPSLFDP